MQLTRDVVEADTYAKVLRTMRVQNLLVAERVYEKHPAQQDGRDGALGIAEGLRDV